MNRISRLVGGWQAQRKVRIAKVRDIARDRAVETLKVGQNG